MAESKQLKSKVQMQKKRIQELEIGEADLRNELASKTDRIAKLMKQVEVLELYQQQTRHIQATNDRLIIARSELKFKDRGVQTYVEFENPSPSLIRTLSQAESVERIVVTTTSKTTPVQVSSSPSTPSTPKQTTPRKEESTPTAENAPQSS